MSVIDGGSMNEVIGISYLPSRIAGLVGAWQNRGLFQGSVAQGSFDDL